jgi:hypothetical protein
VLCAAPAARTDLPTAVADDHTEPGGHPEQIEIVVQEHIQVSD